MATERQENHPTNTNDTLGDNKSMVQYSPLLSCHFLSFPSKLLQILNTPEFNDIICWLPHGRAWRVQQQERLESEVLPKFFNHKKYSSFYRQVCGWGFHRILGGPDYNSFCHELFVRDSSKLALKMKRPSSKELAERRQRFSPDSLPNFYAAPKATSESSGVKTSERPSSSTVAADEHSKQLAPSRLSGASLHENCMQLQIELDLLEKKKAEILHYLQLLRDQSTEHQRIPQLMHRRDTRISHIDISSGSQQSLQRTELGHWQQLRASLSPFIQQAAQSIMLEQEMQYQRGGPYGRNN